MILLIKMGLLPKPDLIAMVDTEREASNVFDYQREHIAPICEDIGVEYVIIKKSEFTQNDVSLASDPDAILPGFFTEIKGRTADGRTNGKQPGYCSVKWKVEPLQRYLNNRFGERELTKRGVDFWIGMSLDEPKRVKIALGKWQKRYPLFEMRITREQAIGIVEANGLPTPPRSSCWMCPNRRPEEWRWMKKNVPDDFRRAVEFEKEMQRDFPYLWLTREGVPLPESKFLIDDSNPLDKLCDSGMCFV